MHTGFYFYSYFSGERRVYVRVQISPGASDSGGNTLAALSFSDRSWSCQERGETSRYIFTGPDVGSVRVRVSKRNLIGPDELVRMDVAFWPAGSVRVCFLSGYLNLS